MIRLSDQFQRLCAKVYTFGLLAFAAKVLHVGVIGLGPAHIAVGDSAKLIGLLALLSTLAWIGCIPCLVRDTVAQGQEDILGDGAENPAAQSSGGAKHPSSDEATRFSGLYFATSWVVMLIEVVIPIAFGVLVSLYCWKEIINLICAVFGWK